LDISQRPYFMGLNGIRKRDLLWKTTKEESEEILKCAKDIKYFANKYCWIKNEQGFWSQVTLRDYQEEIVDSFSNDENRFHILMQSRQTGKCVRFDTKVETEKGKVSIWRLFYRNKKKKLYDHIITSLYWLFDFLTNIEVRLWRLPSGV
jgi:hypothetical protein